MRARFRFGLALLVVAAIAGCATPHLFGSEPGDTAYAAADGVLVRMTPFATSKAIGRLTLHEPVVRKHTERGFAHIVARKGSLEGWVDGDQLLSALPGSDAAPGRQPEKP